MRLWKLLELEQRLKDLELLLLARRREEAIRDGEDTLEPLETVMRQFGLRPAEEDVHSIENGKEPGRTG